MQESTGTPPDQPSVKPPKRGGFGVLLLSIIAILLALCSLGVQYFFWQMHQLMDARMSSQGQQLQASFQGQIQNFLAELSHQKQEITEQKQQLATLLTKNQTDERRKAVLSAQEAKHLLTLAQYNLLFQTNPELASKLLAATDQKLQEINDPGLDPIRKMLTENTTQLASIKPVDVTSIIANLAAISQQVPALSNQPAIPEAPKVKAMSPKKLTWREKLTRTLQSLRGLVTIRRLPEDVKPLPSEAQEVYIVENIRLKLAEAEWAVLHENRDLYQNSLNQAKSLLAKYYARNTAGLNLIKLIDNLIKIDIKPTWPDLVSTISLLNSYINNLNVQSSVGLPAGNTAAQPNGANQVAPAVPPSTGKPNPSTPPPPTSVTPKQYNVQTPQETISPLPRALPS
jgi:uroporphyrin-3 C-methyltransferase